MKLRQNTIMLIAAMFLIGCSAPDPHRKAKLGAAIGAVSGSVIGHQIDSDDGRYIGGAAGALIGAGAGAYMDRQKKIMEEKLTQQQNRNELSIIELEDGSLLVGIASAVSFELNSSELKEQFLPTYDTIAAVLQQFNKTIIHVVGHTDNSGSEEYNQRLSERRAKNVRQYLALSGIDPGRIKTEGRGENDPVAPNDTNQNRKRNRRVDIVIKPIVEGREGQAFASPPPLGQINRTMMEF